MAADKPGLEAQRVPLGVHAGNDLVRIDTHAVENDRQLVHKSDVDVALAVFNHLDGLCGPDGRDRIGPRCDDKIINVRDGLTGFGVHAGNDLSDVFERMDLVARIDALRRIPDPEIHTAFQAGFPLQNGLADVFRDAGVHR